MVTTSRAAALHAVFEAWLASRPARGPRAGNGALAQTSSQLYRDMWTVFVQFQITRPRGRRDPTDLSALRPADLRTFIAAAQQMRQAPWSDRYAWRMLHLIDRVLRFHALATGARAPGSSAAAQVLQDASFRFANAAHLDTEPRPLPLRDVRRVQRHLAGIAADPSPGPAARRWKNARDAGAVAVMLGAGLGPGDVQALPLSGIQLGQRRGAKAWLTVPADRLSPAHQAPLDDWAVPVLQHWLAVRRDQGPAGPWAFPAKATGASPLSRMSCHRSVVGMLEAAGVAGGVPFRLRHACAVSWLRAGHDEDSVAQWLGLQERKALQRYATLARVTRS